MGKWCDSVEGSYAHVYIYRVWCCNDGLFQQKKKKKSTPNNVALKIIKSKVLSWNQYADITSNRQHCGHCSSCCIQVGNANQTALGLRLLVCPR